MSTVRTTIDRPEASIPQGHAARFESTGDGCAHSSTGSREDGPFTRRGLLPGHHEPEPIMNARREPTPDSGLAFQTHQTTVRSQTTRLSPHDHRRSSTGYFVTPCLESATAPSPRLAAIQSVSEAWESDPNLALSPKPILQVVFIARVASPFKRSRPNKGYSFVSCPEDLPEAVDIEIAASSGWFF